MNFIIEKDTHMLYELFKTLYYIANEEDVTINFDETLAKYGIDKENYKNTNMKNFYKFIEKFKKLNKIPIDKIQFYFKDIKDGGTKTNDSLATIFIVNMNPNELTSLKDRILSLESCQLEEFLITDIISFLENIFDSEVLKSITSKDELLKFLITDTKHLSPEMKWNLTVILQNSRDCLLDLIDIIESSINPFQASYSTLAKDKEIFLKELNTTFINEPNFLYTLLGFDINGDDILYIYPSMLNFNSINISYNQEVLCGNPSRYHCYFGYKFKELMALTDGKNNESEFLHDKLKALGDKSKYEILKMLKDGPMYGQQIAEKLSLTTATISYHMNALVLSKLVKLNRLDNKIYYTSNKEEIKSLLNGLDTELI